MTILCRALGQGAFGEVYQGMLKSKNEPSETNVAVKTLPELSTNQGKLIFSAGLRLFDAHGRNLENFDLVLLSENNFELLGYHHQHL